MTLTGIQETNWVDFVEEHGSIDAAAQAAGCSYVAMKHRRGKQLRRAARGALGFSPVLPGFEIKSTAQKMPDGTWVKQVPAAGDEFELPKGHKIIGGTVLLNPENQTKIHWKRYSEDKNIAAFNVDAIKEALSDIKPRLPIARPLTCYEDLLTDYVVGDHHLGLLAWKPETGESFDTKIGEKLLLDKMDELAERTPPSGTAIFTNLGDFFHSNNPRNTTDKSNNHLDVDGRYGKVLMVGLRLAVSCIERLLAKHERVIVCWLAGNHDPQISMGALISLCFKFQQNPRVEIQFNPSKFFIHEHGKTLLFATHGDELKPAGVVPFVTGEYREEWGRTEHCYAKFGHVHHKTSDTVGAVNWESFETLAAKDAWHAGKGFKPGKSGRSMTAITYHNVTGEWSRNRVSV